MQENASKLIEDIYHTMRHAKTFIGTKEKMHPDGIKLYDELLEKIEDIVTKPRAQEECENLSFDPFCM